MLAFTNSYSTVVFAVAVVMLLGGLVTFIVQVICWDSEYEAFLTFPLRLAIYALPYLFIPCLGLAVGWLMVRRGGRVRRKFAKGSVYTSIVGLLFWIASLSLAVR